MGKRTFTKEFLRGVVYDETEGAEVVDDTITGLRRWSVDHWLVFRYEGKLWGVAYSHGATEIQDDERPFEYGPDAPECSEMHAVEKTITAYVPID
jgi:hypothetical protein